MATVFISHTGADKAFACRLFDDLEELGHDPWLDTWEIRTGQSISRRVEEGLTGAERVVVILSAASMQSGWVDREWRAAFTQELKVRGSVLPCLLELCAIPLLLQDLSYADFTKSYQQGLSEVSRSIGKPELRLDELFSHVPVPVCARGHEAAEEFVATYSRPLVIAVKLKKCREAMRLSTQQFAAMAKTTTHAVENIERARLCSATALQRVLDALGVTLADVLGGEEEGITALLGLPLESLTPAAIAGRWEQQIHDSDRLPVELVVVRLPSDLSLRSHKIEGVCLECTSDRQDVLDTLAELKEWYREAMLCGDLLDAMAEREQAKAGFEIVCRINKLGFAVSLGPFTRPIRGDSQTSQWTTESGDNSFDLTMLLVLVVPTGEVVNVAVVPKKLQIVFDT